MKKFKIKYVVYVVLIAIVSYLIGSYVKYVTAYTENTYSLSEIENGTYAIYYTTHSRVPAENYEVITLCFNDSIYTQILILMYILKKLIQFMEMLYMHMYQGEL